EMTARENIAIGRIEEIDNLALVKSAAEKSMADQTIGRLAGGYDQILGRRFEQGVDLSGGEWQKVALARAYLRDAQLLILDEPTAALDARSEFEVFHRFAELTAGKMALFISHRFSTVRSADRILVLENGKIAEAGTHDQLASMGGRYAEMFEMQASSYRDETYRMTPQSGHLELVKAEPKGLRTLLDMGPDLDTLSSSAAELARSLAWIPGQQESQHFRDRCEALNRAYKPLFISLEARAKAAVSDDFRRLQENMYLVSGELQETCATFGATYKLPQVRT